MVFESLVSDLLNRFIGDYVENLDKSQLKIGIWGGNVVLENLKVKENALSDFDVPFKVKAGQIGKLTLKIPWKNLYNDAVVATLDGLYLLVVPGATIKYDAAKEERYQQEAKQRELQRIEEALQTAARRASQSGDLLFSLERVVYKGAPNVSKGSKKHKKPIKGLRKLKRHDNKAGKGGRAFRFSRCCLMLDQHHIWMERRTCTSRTLLQAYLHLAGPEIRVKTQRSGSEIRGAFFTMQSTDSSSSSRLRPKSWTSRCSLAVCLPVCLPFYLGLGDLQADVLDLQVQPGCLSTCLSLYLGLGDLQADVLDLQVQPGFGTLELELSRSGLDDLMTAAEKEKLYTAIGYSGSSHNLALPKQYVSVVVSFQLCRTSVTIRDQPHIPEILKIQIIDLSTRISQRPGAQALRVEVTLQHWFVTGLQQRGAEPGGGQGGALPSLIASLGDSTTSLLSVVFELNPEEGGADQLLRVQSQPVELIYDALTVNSLADFFHTGGGLDLDVLASATRSKLEEIKEKTAAGLSHIIETRKVLDLRINLKPSYLLIPKSGFYSETSDLIVVDFGSLQLTSVEQCVSSPSSSLEEIMDRAYERFNVELRRVQVLYSKSGTDTHTDMVECDSAQVSGDAQVGAPPLPFSSQLTDAERQNGLLQVLLPVPEHTSHPQHLNAPREQVTWGLTNLFDLDLEVKVGEVVDLRALQLVVRRLLAAVIVRSSGSSPDTLNLTQKKCLRDKHMSPGKTYLDMCPPGIDASVLVQAKKTEVFARLRDIVVTDVHPTTVHRKAVSIVGEEVFSFNLLLFPGATLGDAYSDTSRTDGKLTLRLGCIQIVYLHKFLMSLLASFSFQSADEVFVDNFQAAKAAVSAATVQAAEKAASSVRGLAQKSFRLSMDIRLKAPLIIIPQSSSSHNALVMDLGLLTVANSFSLLSADGFALPAVVDQMDVQLTQLKLSRTTLMPRSSAHLDIQMLQPINLELSVTRNLSTSWFTRIPGVQVQGELRSLNMSLGEEDLAVLMKILVENIGEGSRDIRRDAPRHPTQEKQQVEVLPGRELASNHNEAPPENTVNVLLNFEIKEVLLTLTKPRDQVQVPFLVFQVAHLGINTQVKQYDMVATTFINRIAMKCLEFKDSRGEPLCLISSSGEAGAELLKVQYFKADCSAPDFSSVYNNTEQRINVMFMSLDLLLHTEALLSTINFLSAALSSGGETSPERDARPRKERTSKSTTVTSPAKSDIIDLKVMMSLGAFNVLVCDQSCNMADIKIQGIHGSLLMQGTQTHISARLRDFIILNVDPKSIHKKAISIVGDEVFSFSLSLTPKATDGAGYADTSRSDGRVKLNVGCIQVVYLHKFFMSLLNFADHFQAAKAAVSAATVQAAEKAASSVRGLAQKSFRLSMDIRLKAPLIIIPQSSSSHNALVMDLGLLTVANSFSLLSVDGYPLPVAVDDTHVQLTQLKLSRTFLDLVSEQPGAELLEPVNLQLNIRRNLAASWYHKMVAMEINGDLKPMKVELSQEDLAVLLRIMTENLGEASGLDPPAPRPDSGLQLRVAGAPPTGEGGKPPGTSDADEDEALVTMQFNFNIKSLALVLFSNAPQQLAHPQRQQNLRLGELALHQLKTSGKILRDGSMEVTAVLHSCTLEDLRTGLDRVTSRMVGRRDEDSPEAMMDVTYRQSATQRDVVAILQKLYLCASVEFLMAVADFFLQALPQSQTGTAGKLRQNATAGLAESDRLPLRQTTEPRANAKPVSAVRTRLRAVVLDPEVVFVASLMKADAPALTSSFQCNVSLQDEPDGSKSMRANLREVKVLACRFIRDKDDQAVTTVLRPCSVTMETRSHPNQPLSGCVTVEEVIVKISPFILNTVMTITAAMTAKQGAEQREEPQADVSDLWSVMNIYGCNYWFLGVDPATEVTETFRDPDGRSEGETFTAEVKVVQVTLESGFGHRTVPLLLAESTFRGSAQNWSSLLQLRADMSLEVNYFNEVQAVWEPLIERVDAGRRRWNLELEMKNHPIMDRSPVHGDDFVILPEPCTAVSVCSKDTMNITVSQCSLSVLHNLAKAFSESTDSTFDSSLREKAPFTIRNCLGVPVAVQLSTNLRPVPESILQLPVGHSMNQDQDQESILQLPVGHSMNQDQDQQSILRLPAGHSVDLQHSSYEPASRGKLSALQRQESRMFNLSIVPSGYSEISSVSVDRPGRVLFTVRSPEDAVSVLLQVDAAEGDKVVTLRSALQIMNHFSVPFTVLRYCPVSRCLQTVGQAEPETEFHVTLETYRNSAESYDVQEGSKSDLLNARVSGEILSLALIRYQGRDWQGHLRIQQDMPEFLSLCLVCDSDASMTLDLNVHVARTSGRLLLSLFSPYWIINKTSRVLQYRAEDFSVKHPADYRDIVLFSFRKKNLFSKSKIQLCVSTSSWSDGFSLDTVGSYGCVRCPSNNMDFLVGVRIQMSNFNLTRIVTMSPFYTLVNKSLYELEVGEVSTQTPTQTPIQTHTRWHYISSTECLPLWPDSSCEKLCVRVVGSESSSKSFFFNRQDNGTLLSLDTCGGVMVDVNISDLSTIISFTDYYEGSAPALLLNHTPWVSVSYRQSGSAVDHQLKPGEARRFAWDDPAGVRTLSWTCRDHSGELDLLKDEVGQFSYDSLSQVHWVSFLDGRQRVLLFTEDVAVVTKARQAEELEQFQQEVKVSLQHLGLSLVNNATRQEIAYIGIPSSGVVWEMKPRNRWKSFSQKNIDLLEKTFQSQKRGWVTLESNLEVNLSDAIMMMRRPISCPVRRNFLSGIQVEFKQSPHQRCLRAQLHWLQVDNQLPGAIFPIVFHPVPPPKSIALDSEPKPFIDVSVITRFNRHSSVMQFKYFMALVQEMAVKIDQGFLAAILALFTPAADLHTDRQKSRLLERDLQLLQTELTEASLTDSSGLSFFQHFHISPIKLHLSLSLGSGGDEDSAAETAALQSLNLLLKSIGATLTDVDDLIFKLAFFEVRYQFYRRDKLMWAVIRHYTEQFLKQMYVLVLGLDVLGNPFGLIRGLSEGVEAFFYEPFQGAVQGPEEFAEGFAIGVRSLLGHTVGGAAGMVSRITGSVGKGLAAITMDRDFQQRRREEMNRPPRDFGESLAKGGKGLLKGVVGGVTGIVTKPVEGAMKGGAAGFFKGIGKGLVGVVARPTGGIVDMASSTFQGIQRGHERAAESTEEVTKLRPVRLIREDGIIRPYDLTESQGFDLFQPDEELTDQRDSF
ncbi:vacuolar protein sorting-associated protein 13C-like [Etheostoma cragini]|uniref:vacuolar protein sorting-associated protein 13C-like n=1 Tax=Etheostoma cragini TaxID=417921 RepID=UPI00155F500A|nr:vacuolar protein sorting-associated protein 13C-like [Etheostoma cragini]